MGEQVSGPPEIEYAGNLRAGRVATFHILHPGRPYWSVRTLCGTAVSGYSASRRMRDGALADGEKTCPRCARIPYPKKHLHSFESKIDGTPNFYVIFGDEYCAEDLAESRGGSVRTCHIKRTPAEWESIFGIKVHDPDGWDRSNFAESWAEELTELEFARRASASTCSGDFDRLRAILRADS